MFALRRFIDARSLLSVARVCRVSSTSIIRLKSRKEKEKTLSSVYESKFRVKPALDSKLYKFNQISNIIRSDDKSKHELLLERDDVLVLVYQAFVEVEAEYR